MATTISKLFPTGVLQAGVELDETVLLTPGGSAQFVGDSLSRLTIPANTAITFGTKNHTIEFWMYQTSRNLYDTVWTYGNNYSTYAANAYYLNCGTSQFQILLGNGGDYLQSTNLIGNPPSLNAWHHYAIVRDGGTIALYVDGTNRGTLNAGSQNITAQPGPMVIGGAGSPETSITGYVSNFRVVNNSAVYTGDFTPPTAPLTLLGSGSANLVGTSKQKLSVAANTAFTLGTRNFTIELWFKQTSRSSYDGVFGYGTAATAAVAGTMNLDIGTLQYNFSIGNGSSYAVNQNIGGGLPSLNIWHHLAVVRNGTTFTVFVDGVNRAMANGISYSIPAQPGPLLIGSQTDGTSTYFTGQITNFRVVNGTALYTSDFTPSNVALTPIANTVLLLSHGNNSTFLLDSSINNFTVTNSNTATFTLATPFRSTEILLNQSNSASLLTDSSPNRFTLSNINSVTYDNLTPFKLPLMRVSPTGIYAVEFDEVNLDSGVAERKKSDGVYQVSGYFDDYTLSAVPLVSGAQFNLLSAPSSGTTWTDVSGNGYNATLQGSASYVSNNGGGIKLNNANSVGTDYISVPYNISSNTVTVELVASFNPTGYWATIWGNDSYSAGRGFLAFMSTATTITYGKPAAGSTETITASNDIRHWVFVINGTQQSLYLNGTQVGTTDTVTNQTLFATSELYFGARHTNGGTGPADRLNSSTSANQPVFYQMRLYNRVLSPSEVTQNYNAVKSTYGI